MQLPDFLTADPQGEIFLTGHRITLQHIVRKHREGLPPEMIVQWFPTVSLATVYNVLAFMLENEDAVNQYVDSIQLENERLAAAPNRGPSFDELQRRFQALTSKSA